MRDKWLRVRELFERALEEQPADIDAWLTQEEPDQPDVRAEVRSLYENHSRAGEFLVKPITDRVPELLNEDDPYEPGHKLGQYKIVRRLPGGGMGRVYLATDTLGRNVVLKAVASRFAGEAEHGERLRREAQALAELDHPGICKVYTFENFDGEDFIVTEYVDGPTLREEIASGSRPLPGEVLRTARDIAAALACAHSGRIVHRDLKPENIMRTADGRIKIIDFGIARVDDPQGHPQAIDLTQPGVALGTPIYMAPEQLNREHVGTQADVFAFGVLIYELACGLHPFGSSPQRILDGNPPPIDSLCPALAGPVAAVIGRCLRKPPAERFASAAEILAALEPLPPPPLPTPDTQAVNWWRAHQAIVIGLYFLACVFAWLIKQGLGPVALGIFIIVTAAATIGGVLRSHLLFVYQTTRQKLVAERQRTDSYTVWTDAVIGLALVVDAGLLLTTGRHVAAALLAALGIGLILARVRLEPSIADEAFGPSSTSFGPRPALP